MEGENVKIGIWKLSYPPKGSQNQLGVNSLVESQGCDLFSSIAHHSVSRGSVSPCYGDRESARGP